MKKIMRWVSVVMASSIFVGGASGCVSNLPLPDIESETESVLVSPQITEESSSTSSVVAETKPTGKVQGVCVNEDASFLVNTLSYPFSHNGKRVKTLEEFQLKNTSKEDLAELLISDNAPSFFVLDSSEMVEQYADYCYDLSDAKVYNNLVDPNLTLKIGKEVKAVPISFDAGCHGILYNKKILNQYFEMEGAKAKSVDDIKTFESFKNVVEDIQAKKDSLGIEGAFTSSGLDPSSAWRFSAILSSFPVYCEFNQDHVISEEKIKGTYLNEFKNVWDLYINNATVSHDKILNRTDIDCLYELIDGKAIFYQSGTWSYSELSDNGWTHETVGFLPIYFGADNGFEGGMLANNIQYICVNSHVSEDDRKAALEYLDFVTSDEECAEQLANIYSRQSMDRIWIVPYKVYSEVEMDDTNPLLSDVLNYFENGGTVIRYCTDYSALDSWKSNLADALGEYVSGGDWSAVEKAFVENWQINESE